MKPNKALPRLEVSRRRGRVLRASTRQLGRASALLMLALPALAETRYVDDVLYVPVRTGESGGHTIIHKGLVSGSAVEVLNDNSDTGFSHILLSDGREGYIRTRYLSREPIAQVQLEQALSTIESLSGDQQPLQKELLELRGTRQEQEQAMLDLKYERDQAEKRLEEIKEISENAVNTAQRNRVLIEDNQSLRNQLDVLKAENDRMQQSTDRASFINGAGAVLLGVIIALIIPRVTPRKRNSEWA